MPRPVSRQLRSAAAPPEFLAQLSALTAPLDGGFVLEHRLSGAGIVVRTLAAPETDRPLFGKLRGETFSLALVPTKHDITPYHPIVRGRIEPDGSGSRLTVTWAHHPGVREYTGLFAFGGVVLGLGAVLGSSERPAVVAGGLGLAVMFLAFPWLRARQRFVSTVERHAQAFCSLLDLDPAQ